MLEVENILMAKKRPTEEERREARIPKKLLKPNNFVNLNNTEIEKINFVNCIVPCSSINNNAPRDGVLQGNFPGKQSIRNGGKGTSITFNLGSPCGVDQRRLRAEQQGC